jgi:hypothetical protein
MFTEEDVLKQRDISCDDNEPARKPAGLPHRQLRARVEAKLGKNAKGVLKL